ncbi:hypothetical protein [Nocardioides sp.]|uniref:hypothetical protein n=1 Tax=Nocardioides sp. TaxID=35761 RepID=UPI002C35C71C|nr:hypothetical protein [Nocardioides sp.]HXH79113.1 hypothetical protein [Nocardioides sp.]
MTDTLRQWAPMFNDCAENVHDLPADVLKAHKAVIRLDEKLAAIAADRPDPNAATREVVAATKAAALAGKAWPEVSAIRVAADAVADYDARRQTIERAREEMAGEVHDLIITGVDVIFSEYLRPVHDRLAATFTAAAKVIPEAPTTDMLMRADDKVRTAWLSLDDSVSAYTRIRNTAERLNRLNPVQNDTSGEFAMMRNTVDVWPDWQVGRTAPWASTDPRLTYLWLIRHGAELWLPTSAERDAAWWAKHGEAVERHRTNRQQSQALAAVMGG